MQKIYNIFLHANFAFIVKIKTLVMIVNVSQTIHNLDFEGGQYLLLHEKGNPV